MTDMRFAVRGTVGKTPKTTAESLAKLAWDSPVGAGYFALVEGVLMVANAGQQEGVVLARWKADREAVVAKGFAPATQAVPSDLPGGMNIQWLEEHFSRANTWSNHGEPPAPVYGEWTNIAVWYNPGSDPALIGKRLLEDQDAKGPWFDKRRA